MLQQTDLEAINSEQNIHRYYTLIMDKNLFDEFTVITIYGRVGYRGTTKSYLFETKDQAKTKYDNILKKRLTSHKRIGTNYIILK